MSAPRSRRRDAETLVTLQFVGPADVAGRPQSAPSRPGPSSPRASNWTIEQHRPGAATIRLFEGPLRKGEVFSFVSYRSHADPLGLINSYVIASVDSAS